MLTVRQPYLDPRRPWPVSCQSNERALRRRLQQPMRRTNSTSTHRCRQVGWLYGLLMEGFSKLLLSQHGELREWGLPCCHQISRAMRQIGCRCVPARPPEKKLIIEQLPAHSHPTVHRPVGGALARPGRREPRRPVAESLAAGDNSRLGGAGFHRIRSLLQPQAITASAPGRASSRLPPR